MTDRLPEDRDPHPTGPVAHRGGPTSSHTGGRSYSSPVGRGFVRGAGRDVGQDAQVDVGRGFGRGFGRGARRDVGHDAQVDVGRGGGRGATRDTRGGDGGQSSNLSTEPPLPRSRGLAIRPPAGNRPALDQRRVAEQLPDSNNILDPLPNRALAVNGPLSGGAEPPTGPHSGDEMPETPGERGITPMHLLKYLFCTDRLSVYPIPKPTRHGIPPVCNSAWLIRSQLPSDDYSSAVWEGQLHEGRIVVQQLYCNAKKTGVQALPPHAETWLVRRRGFLLQEQFSNINRPSLVIAHRASEPGGLYERSWQHDIEVKWGEEWCERLGGDPSIPLAQYPFPPSHPPPRVREPILFSFPEYSRTVARAAEGEEPAPNRHVEPAPNQHVEPAPNQHVEPAPNQHVEPAPNRRMEPNRRQRRRVRNVSSKGPQNLERSGDGRRRR